MTSENLGDRYRQYLGCLNTRRLEELDEYVADRLTYNGQARTRQDYREMLAADIAAIPDLHFELQRLIVSADWVAARLWFNCTPEREFLGFRAPGHSISFSEHVFYRFRDGKICEVWSVIDTQAIRAQLEA
jgi:predicted ester cyclase